MEHEQVWGSAEMLLAVESALPPDSGFMHSGLLPGISVAMVGAKSRTTSKFFIILSSHSCFASQVR